MYVFHDLARTDCVELDSNNGELEKQRPAFFQVYGSSARASCMTLLLQATFPVNVENVLLWIYE